MAILTATTIVILILIVPSTAHCQSQWPGVACGFELHIYSSLASASPPTICINESVSTG